MTTCNRLAAGLLTLGFSFAALAQTPDTAPAAPATPATPAAAPAAPATPATPAAPAAAETSAADSLAEKQHADVIKWGRNHGYKPSLLKGKPMWCKREAQIGSKLESSVCVSEESLTESYKTFLLQDSSGWRPSSCNTPGCISH